MLCADSSIKRNVQFQIGDSKTAHKLFLSFYTYSIVSGEK